MTHSYFFTATVAATAIIGFTGCATVLEGETDMVEITSEPTGAAVTLVDAMGASQDISCVTPCELNLSRGVFRATVTKDGYAPFTYQISPRSNLGRALVTAGGSYAAIIDSRNGSDKVMGPKFVRVDLAPSGGRSVAIDKKGRVIKTLDYGEDE